MVVTYIGVGIGQLFLNLADPQEYPLYVLTSVLISIAVVPLLLSATSSPSFEESVNISAKELYKITPLGIVGTFVVGLVTATFFALGPVYAQRLGLNLQQISYFMAAAVVGTVLLQWPIGALSDRYDRRVVLTIITMLTSFAAFAVVLIQHDSIMSLLLTVGLFSGLALPLYSICIAYTNDHLAPNQMIAASGALVLVGGLGAVVGPLLVAMVMDQFGNPSFFWSMGIAHLVTGLFAMYRMTRRKLLTVGKKGSVSPAAMHATSSAIEGIQQYAKEETSSDEVSSDEMRQSDE
jgi:MFS family permease